jgi:hypothetical protein
MYKALVPAVLCLALAVPSAWAGGVNLGWGTLCYTEHPVSIAAFACDTDDPGLAWPVTLSFAIDRGMADMVGLEISLSAQSSVAQLPDWWRFDVNGCRDGAMDFVMLPPEGACRDWTSGAPFGAAVWNSGQDQYRPGDDPYYGPIYTDPACARIVGVVAIDARYPFDMQPGVEYFACTYVFRNSRTVGAGACGGCATALSLDARQICVAGLDGRRDYLTSPLPGGNRTVQWQGRTADQALPAHATTWGAVKSLYR